MEYTKHLPRVFTEEEISLIIDTILHSERYCINPMSEFLRWRDMTTIGIMYYCGLRPAECLQLKWEDLDFEKKLIYVRPYINHNRYIRRKNDLPAIITNPAEKIFLKFKEKCNELKVNNEYIFPSFWTWKPITTSAMNRIFLDFCKELGFAKIEYRDRKGQSRYSVSLYSLRHSFCTRIYKKTGSEIAVSRLARHTQVQSASIYTHLNFEDKQEIAQKVFG